MCRLHVCTNRFMHGPRFVLKAGKQQSHHVDEIEVDARFPADRACAYSQKPFCQLEAIFCRADAHRTPPPSPQPQPQQQQQQSQPQLHPPPTPTPKHNNNSSSNKNNKPDMTGKTVAIDQPTTTNRLQQAIVTGFPQHYQQTPSSLLQPGQNHHHNNTSKGKTCQQKCKPRRQCITV